MDSELDSSDEEPHLDRGGGAERLGRRVMATYVATPSHEKTYPSACANDGCCCSGSTSIASSSASNFLDGGCCYRSTSESICSSLCVE